MNITGTLRGASYLPPSTAFAFCRWHLQAGPAWTLLSGARAGHTQAAALSSPAGCAGSPAPPLSFTGEAYEPAAGAAAAVWEHPIDAHFSCAALGGWPQLVVTVWAQDELSRSEVVGYGCARVPAAPGRHVLEVATWRPEGTWAQEMRAAFLGSGLPQLEDAGCVWDPAGAPRSGLCSATGAVVEVELQVMARGFGELGVALAP